MRRSKPPADLVLREIEALYRTGYPTFVRVVTGIVGNEDAARGEGFLRVDGVYVSIHASDEAEMLAVARALRAFD